jgi:hypothetical protein
MSTTGYGSACPGEETQQKKEKEGRPKEATWRSRKRKTREQARQGEVQET